MLEILKDCRIVVKSSKAKTAEKINNLKFKLLAKGWDDFWIYTNEIGDITKREIEDIKYSSGDEEIVHIKGLDCFISKNGYTIANIDIEGKEMVLRLHHIDTSGPRDRCTFLD